MSLLFPRQTNDYLRAETLSRVHATGVVPAAVRRRALTAAESASDAQAKLLAYYQALPEAQRVGRLLTIQRRGLGLAVAALLAAAFVAGALSALSALGGNEARPVNILWCLAGLLGLHGLTFLLWLAVIAVIPERPARWSLGAGALWLWRCVAERLTGSGLAGAARRALAQRLVSPPAGRWVASSLSHGLWLAYLAGALVMAIVILSTRHVVFVWETTILGAGDYEVLIGALTAGPAFLGFPVPAAEAIAAAEWRGGAPPGEQSGPAWSGFLLGSLVVYGLFLRAGALALCLWRGRRALRRSGLDLTDPAFARLIPELAPVVRRTHVLDDDETRPAQEGGSLRPGDPSVPPPGSVAILGWEIDTPATGWPPAMPEAEIVDLGIEDDRAGLRAALTGPEAQKAVRIVLVVDLRTTPDRGVSAGLKAAVEAAGDRLFLLLICETAARRRLGEGGARQRLADWVSAAHAAGFALDQIATLDLDYMTDGDRGRLARIIGGGDGG